METCAVNSRRQEGGDSDDPGTASSTAPAKRAAGAAEKKRGPLRLVMLCKHLYALLWKQRHEFVQSEGKVLPHPKDTVGAFVSFYGGQGVPFFVNAHSRAHRKEVLAKFGPKSTLTFAWAACTENNEHGLGCKGFDSEDRVLADVTGGLSIGIQNLGLLNQLERPEQEARAQAEHAGREVAAAEAELATAGSPEHTKFTMQAYWRQVLVVTSSGMEPNQGIADVLQDLVLIGDSGSRKRNERNARVLLQTTVKGILADLKAGGRRLAEARFYERETRSAMEREGKSFVGIDARRRQWELAHWEPVPEKKEVRGALRVRRRPAESCHQRRGAKQ